MAVSSCQHNTLNIMTSCRKARSIYLCTIIICIILIKCVSNNNKRSTRSLSLPAWVYSWGYKTTRQDAEVSWDSKTIIKGLRVPEWSKSIYIPILIPIWEYSINELLTKKFWGKFTPSLYSMYIFFFHFRQFPINLWIRPLWFLTLPNFLYQCVCSA